MLDKIKKLDIQVSRAELMDTADYNIAVKFEQFRKGLLDTTHAHLTESNNASIVIFMKLTAVDYFRDVAKGSADKYFLQANSYVCGNRRTLSS